MRFVHTRRDLEGEKNVRMGWLVGVGIRSNLRQAPEPIKPAIGERGDLAGHEKGAFDQHVLEFAMHEVGACEINDMDEDFDHLRHEPR